MKSSSIKVWKGDITDLAVDVIVNAANSGLRGGGGVDGAIHRKGGPVIMQECDQIRGRQGGCKTGEAVVTSAGDLSSKHVIHTVGPIYTFISKDEAKRHLQSCYRNSLLLAKELGAKSIAFSSISTGVYGYPKKDAVEHVHELLVNEPGLMEGFEEVGFVCFDDENFALYSEKFRE